MREIERNGSEYQIRRSVLICQRIRHPSPNDGASSSVLATAIDAPAARRSCRPRTGSRRRRARTTKISVGMPKRMKGMRQPKRMAMNPARRGPANWPRELAARWKPYTFCLASSG